MGFRFTRLPRARQPQEQVGPNPEWLARQLSYLWGWPNGSSNLRLRNLVDGTSADAQDLNNDLAGVVTPFGLAGRNRATTAANACYYLASTSALSGAQELTLLAWFVFGAADDNNQWVNFRQNNQHTLDVFSKTSTSITWGADWAGAWNGASTQTLSGLVDGDLVCIGASINQSGARFFANGRFSGTKSGSGFTTSGSSVGITQQTRASQLGGAVLRSALSDAEMQALTGNPWLLFEDELLLVPSAAPSGDQTITVSDSGAGSDTITIGAALSIAETGAGTDALSIGAALALADSGTGTDGTPSITVTVTLTDAGTGTETFAGSATIALTDSGAGSDALSILTATLVSIADSATGSDAVAITVSLALTDAGTGTEGLGGATSFALADTGAGADAVSVVSDILKAVADVATGTDAVSITVQLAVPDTGAGLEALGITAALAVLDQGIGYDVVVNSAPGLAKIVSITFTARTRRIAFSATARTINFTMH